MSKGTSISIHYATNLRVAEYYPENDQMITLRVSQGLHIYQDIQIFGLPEELVNKLLEVLPPQTVYKEEERVEDEVPF